jgi:hypothetical protein
MRILGKCILFCAAVAAVYFWRGKRVLVRDFVQYGASAHERHGLEILEFRYRPVTVWRFDVDGSRSAHAEYTYGATELRSMPQRRWCGKGMGVTIEVVLRYDYGDSRATRVFYNFKTGSLLTTLDYGTKDSQIAAAIEECDAE